MVNVTLIEALRAVDVVRFGEFELSHGGTSSYYMNKYLFETDLRCLKFIAEVLAKRVANDNKLADVALGTVPLVTATAIETNKPCVIARKKTKGYRTAERTKGAPDEGEEVVALKDIATTGQSAVNTVEVLRETDAVIDRIVAVMDRQEGTAELLVDHDITLESFLTVEDLLTDVDG